MTLRRPWLPPLTLERNSSGGIANSARIGTAPVGGTQWRPVASAENWLLVGGSMQLASWGPSYLIAGGDSVTLRAYCWPRPQCFARLWTLVMQGVQGSRGVIETADRPGGVSFALDTGFGPTVVNIAEVVSSTTPSGEEISVVVSSDASNPAENVILIKSATCTELPLSRALPSDGMGVHEASLEKWKQIAELDASLSSHRSVAGVMRASTVLTEGLFAHRRAKIFSWHHETGVTTTSSTFANIFRIDPSCQTRKVLAAGTETYRACKMAVYAAASTGAGRVRVTSSIDASTYTFNINSATPAWYESGSFNIACDDTDSAGWVRGSRETLTIEHRALSGNNIVYGVEVGEE